jgi:hypothetical protein
VELIFESLSNAEQFQSFLQSSGVTNPSEPKEIKSQGENFQMMLTLVEYSAINTPSPSIERQRHSFSKKVITNPSKPTTRSTKTVVNKKTSAKGNILALADFVEPQPLKEQWTRFLASKAARAKPDAIAVAVAECHEALFEYPATHPSDEKLLKILEKLLYNALPLCYWLDRNQKIEKNALKPLESWLIGVFQPAITACIGHRWYTVIKALHDVYQTEIATWEKTHDMRQYAQLTIPRHGHFLIDASVARKMLCQDNRGNHLPKTLGGNHFVAHYVDKTAGVDIYCKRDSGQYRR